MSLAVADLDHARYASEGYLHVPGLIDPRTVAMLKAEEARFAAARGRLAVTVGLVHRSAPLRAFIADPRLVRLAVALLGPDVCFTHQQYITKRPEPDGARARTDVPWHQDSGFGRIEPAHDLTVWIALDDCDEHNGCLRVLPGSHRAGLVPHSDVGGLRCAAVRAPGLAVPTRAGDAVVFGGHLLHASAPNASAAPRTALYLRYCHPAVTLTDPLGTRPVLDDGQSWMVAGEAPAPAAPTAPSPSMEPMP